MLVTFKSDAYENTVYLSAVAQQLLALLGHSGTIPGAIKAADLPQALINLQQGLAQHHEPLSLVDDDVEPEIKLTLRAAPLIQLLQASIKKNCDVLWCYGM